MSFMGMLSSAKDHVRGGSSVPTQSSSPDKHAKEAAPEGSDPNDTEVLDDEPRNMLIALVGQLRIGMDLSKITLPTFVLEVCANLEQDIPQYVLRNLWKPRSMLERITDFISHADFVFDKGSEKSAEARFFAVTQCYLAGWHIKPKGVKKPYNPILGEIFRCRYDYADGTKGYYIAEQVCHHPPISAFYFVSPDHKVIIRGELRPKSRFLGNSAATIMEGANRIAFLDRPEDGEYVITMPNMYARGILFGKMVLELGDECNINNEQTDYHAKIDFKTKGFFSGEYNSISGKAKHGHDSIADISGKWSDEIDLKKKGGSKSILFDTKNAGTVTPKTVSQESDQLPNESRRLWAKVTQGIREKDMTMATDAKTEIEDAQREKASQREASGEAFQPVYFKLVGDQWQPNFVLPSDASKANDEVVKWIWGNDPQPVAKGTAAK